MTARHVVLALAIALAACEPTPPDTGAWDPGVCGPTQVVCHVGAGVNQCKDLSIDAANCGLCGVTCGRDPKTGRPVGQCVLGVCQCPAPTTLCPPPVSLPDMTILNACPDLSSDNANCGACGQSCWALKCVAGHCT